MGGDPRDLKVSCGGVELYLGDIVWTDKNSDGMPGQNEAKHQATDKYLSEDELACFQRLVTLVKDASSTIIEISPEGKRPEFVFGATGWYRIKNYGLLSGLKERIKGPLKVRVDVTKLEKRKKHAPDIYRVSMEISGTSIKGKVFKELVTGEAEDLRSEMFHKWIIEEWSRIFISADYL